MKTLKHLIARNVLVFFKDKGTVFSAMIAPLILLALYILFLGNVFGDSFKSAIPEGIQISSRLINGYVAGWELSSILAVCTVSIAFIANMTMVQDRVDNTILDFTISPVKQSTLALGYYIATAITTLIVCYLALAVGLLYVAMVGWYLTFTDILLIIGDVFVMSLFGTALSSVVCFFLKTLGGISAVATIVSSIYGFLCGAYYPISQFSQTIQNIIVCLPGTYGTSLIRNHLLQGVVGQLGTEYHLPDSYITEMKDAFDINLYFFDHQVSIPVMYLVVAITIVVLVGIFVLQNLLKKPLRH